MSRLAPDARKSQILGAALTLATAAGYQAVTRQAVAAAVPCSLGLVSRYYGTMPQLKRAIMRAAVAAENLTVIAQGLAAKDPQALKAPEDIRRRAAATLAGV